MQVSFSTDRQRRSTYNQSKGERVASELWQRIRAARKHADKTQQEVADKCGVTRGLVAQWESIKPENRTNPTIDQLSVFADLTGVDIGWLTNNRNDPDDLLHRGTYTKLRKGFENQRHDDDAEIVSYKRVLPAPTPSPAFDDRILSSFINAVEYELLKRHSPLADGFNHHLKTGLPLPVPLTYLYNTGATEVALQIVQRPTITDLGCLLFATQVSHDPSRVRKVLLLWQPAGAPPLPEDTRLFLQDQIPGLLIHIVETPAEAADLISHLF